MKRTLVLGLAYLMAVAVQQRTKSQTPPTYGTPVPTTAAETFGPFIKGTASLFGGPDVNTHDSACWCMHLQPVLQ